MKTSRVVKERVSGWEGVRRMGGLDMVVEVELVWLV